MLCSTSAFEMVYAFKRRGLSIVHMYTTSYELLQNTDYTTTHSTHIHTCADMETHAHTHNCAHVLHLHMYIIHICIHTHTHLHTCINMYTHLSWHSETYKHNM